MLLPAAHGSLQVPLHLGFSLCLSFIMQLASAAESYEDFSDPPLVEIHFQGHQGQAFFMGFAGELSQFALVYQQFAGPLGRVIPDGRLRVFRDVAIDEPQLAVADAAKCFGQRDLAVPEAFDFAPR